MLPAFTAEVSVASARRQDYFSSVQSGREPESLLLPQQGLNCGNTFLNTVCPIPVGLARAACWWAWWNRDVYNGCVKAHVLASSPWCNDCVP